MKLQLLLVAVVVSVVALLLSSCSSFDQSNAVYALEQMRRDGLISQVQYDALVAALTQGSWTEFAELLAAIGLSVVGSLTGVRVWRGSVTHRKGVLSPPLTLTEPAPAPTEVVK